MAVQAAFPHRRMLPEERSAFFRVAVVAKFVDGIPFEHRFRGGAMRIVAVDAGYLSLRKRHVGTLGKLGTLLFVAGIARLVDRCFLEQSTLGNLAHRVVTVAAGELVPTMLRTRPKHCIAALVAGETHAILFFDGCSPLAGEPHQGNVVGGIGWIFDVIGTWTMARFARPLLQFILRIQPKDVGMNCMGKLVVLRRMARNAHCFAHVLGTAIQRLGYFRFGRRCRLRPKDGKDGHRPDAKRHDTYAESRR